MGRLGRWEDGGSSGYGDPGRDRKVDRTKERTNEWINGRIDMTYRSGGMRNGKGEEGWEYPRIAMQSSRATDGEDERGVWAMTYGRGQVALTGPSAAELDLDVLCGEFKALKRRVRVSKMKTRW